MWIYMANNRHEIIRVSEIIGIIFICNSIFYVFVKGDFFTGRLSLYIVLGALILLMIFRTLLKEKRRIMDLILVFLLCIMFSAISFFIVHFLGIYPVLTLFLLIIGVFMLFTASYLKQKKR